MEICAYCGEADPGYVCGDCGKVAYCGEECQKNDFIGKKNSNKKVSKVMKEFKEGKLHSGSKKGPIVTDRKQALAIALDEARRASSIGLKADGIDDPDIVGIKTSDGKRLQITKLQSVQFGYIWDRIQNGTDDYVTLNNVNSSTFTTLLDMQDREMVIYRDGRLVDDLRTKARDIEDDEEYIEITEAARFLRATMAWRELYPDAISRITNMPITPEFVAKYKDLLVRLAEKAEKEDPQGYNALFAHLRAEVGQDNAVVVAIRANRTQAREELKKRRELKKQKNNNNE